MRNYHRILDNVRTNPQMLIIFVVLIALVLKCANFATTEIISNDGPRCINQALQFIRGDFKEALERDNLFLYALLISFFGRFGVDPVLAGELISLVASVGVVFPLYRLFCGHKLAPCY